LQRFAPLITHSTRRTPNAERRTPNAERQTPNAKRQTPNAKRQTPNAKRQTPNAVSIILHITTLSRPFASYFICAALSGLLFVFRAAG
jgi:hypothetical protein